MTTLTLTEQLRRRQAERAEAAERERAEAARLHREAVEKAESLDDYRARLAAADPGTPAAFEKLMATLGLSLADVEADVAAVAKVARYESRVATPENVQALYDDWAAEAAAVFAEQRDVLRKFVEAVPDDMTTAVLSALRSGLAFAGRGVQDLGAAAASLLDGAAQEARNERLLARKKLYEETLEESRHARALAERFRRENPRAFGGAGAVES